MEGYSKLDGILRTERYQFHGHHHPVQMAPLPSRDHFALCPLVPPVSAQLSRSGGDDARAGLARRSYNDLSLGATLCTELEKRCRPYFKATNDSWRVDETYIKVKKV